MSDEPFLRAIRSAPADPLPRLIYADRLDELERPAEAALQRVLAEPEDDHHRLFYAGLLKETAGVVACPKCRGTTRNDIGHPAGAIHCAFCSGGTVPDGRAERAEFIRAQVELATITCHCNDHGYVRADDLYDEREFDQCDPCPYCRRWELRRRELELLTWEQGCEWSGLEQSVWELLTECRYHRGFASEIACTAQNWLDHADTILDACPVRGAKDGVVRLTTYPGITISGAHHDGRTFVDPGTVSLTGRSIYLTPDWAAIRALQHSAAQVDVDAVNQWAVPLLLRLEWPGVRFELPQSASVRTTSPDTLGLLSW